VLAESFNPFNHLAKAAGNDVRVPVMGVTETPMRARLLAAALMLLPAGPAIADPAQAPAPQSRGPQHSRPVAVLASAETVKVGAADSTQTPPAAPKHRIARVTTCRCGDPQPGEVSDSSPDE
jgi:hypothetical protein